MMSIALPPDCEIAITLPGSEGKPFWKAIFSAGT